MLLQAGASARERLIAAAAQRWNVPPSECEAANSKVTHKNTGRSFEYGELAADAGKIKLDKEPVIRTPDQFKLIGKPLQRLDTPLKINGAAKFAIDTQVPGMVYAAVAACPVFGGATQRNAPYRLLKTARSEVDVPWVSPGAPWRPPPGQEAVAH
jgi:isoquinoline 1-oxidoreductase beta subunit